MIKNDLSWQAIKKQPRTDAAGRYRSLVLSQSVRDSLGSFVPPLTLGLRTVGGFEFHLTWR